MLYIKDSEKVSPNEYLDALLIQTEVESQVRKDIILNGFIYGNNKTFSCNAGHRRLDTSDTYMMDWKVLSDKRWPVY